ncbi:hypothetical protein HK097_002511, partial [Rhizophlyctis rosea]
MPRSHPIPLVSYRDLTHTTPQYHPLVPFIEQSSLLSQARWKWNKKGDRPIGVVDLDVSVRPQANRELASLPEKHLVTSIHPHLNMLRNISSAMSTTAVARYPLKRNFSFLASQVQNGDCDDGVKGLSSPRSTAAPENSESEEMACGICGGAIAKQSYIVIGGTKQHLQCHRRKRMPTSPDNNQETSVSANLSCADDVGPVLARAAEEREDGSSGTPTVAVEDTNESTNDAGEGGAVGGSVVGVDAFRTPIHFQINKPRSKPSIPSHPPAKFKIRTPKPKSSIAGHEPVKFE